MWNYLKSDIAELVSAVKEDTATVFETVSTTDDATNDIVVTRLTPAKKEALRRMKEEESFTVPLLALPPKISPTIGAGTTSSSSSSSITAEDDSDANVDTTHDTDVTSPPDDVGEEQDNDDNDNDAWDAADWAEAEAVALFRTSFNLQDRTDEIAVSLEQYPDTLKVHFETLVPEFVSYEEFWERFFYRCNEERIANEWAIEDERARQARAELVGSVSNFFGVAAKAVVTGVTSALHDEERSQRRATRSSSTADVKNRQSSQRGALQGLFGASGRPPFVMNTAVDEDEEDDEELGWDDDEDEDDDDDEAPVTGAPLSDEPDVEQIVFKDEALDSVTEQLKQAIEERDQLHQTVQLQTKEIITLKDSNESFLKEVADLRTELQSNETHDALSLPQPTNYMSDDDIAETYAEIQRLVDLVATKDTELSTVKRENASSHENLLLTVEALEKRNERLSQELVVANTDAAHTMSLLHSEIAALKTELVQTKERLDVSSNKVEGLCAELEQRQQQQKEQAFPSNVTEPVVRVVDSEGGTRSADAIATFHSTGVQKMNDTPVPPSGGDTVVSRKVVAAVAAASADDVEDDEEEGWGDDWD